MMAEHPNNVGPGFPNLLETMSHCPIDDSKISQCAIAHHTYTLFIAVKF